MKYIIDKRKSCGTFVCIYLIFSVLSGNVIADIDPGYEVLDENASLTLIEKYFPKEKYWKAVVKKSKCPSHFKDCVNSEKIDFEFYSEPSFSFLCYSSLSKYFAIDGRVEDDGHMILAKYTKNAEECICENSLSKFKIIKVPIETGALKKLIAYLSGGINVDAERYIKINFEQLDEKDRGVVESYLKTAQAINYDNLVSIGIEYDFFAKKIELSNVAEPVYLGIYTLEFFVSGFQQSVVVKVSNLDGYRIESVDFYAK